MPESCAAKGRHEPIDDDERAFFAIQYRFGVRLEYEVESCTGEPTGLPNREEAACRVLYVTSDGNRAIVEEWAAQRENDGWTPTDDFTSVVAKPADAGEPVASDHREHYRDLLTARYQTA